MRVLEFIKNDKKWLLRAVFCVLEHLFKRCAEFPFVQYRTGSLMGSVPSDKAFDFGVRYSFVLDAVFLKQSREFPVSFCNRSKKDTFNETGLIG